MLAEDHCLTAKAKAMNSKFAALTLAGLLLIATGCEKASKSAARASVTTALMGLPAYAMGFAGSSQRFIAERHKLEIITPESELQKSWDSAVAFCGTIQCEIVSSSITTRTGDSAPSGGISLRVAPEDLNIPPNEKIRQRWS